MKKLSILILLPIALTSFACNSVNNKTPGDDLLLTSIEMNNTYGDATLIQYHDFDILIDSGTQRDANHIKEVLNAKVADKTIDLLIVTHPHGDHIGGIIGNCLDGLNVLKIVDYGYTYNTSGSDEIENSSYVNQYLTKRNEMVNAGAEYHAVKDLANANKAIYIDKNEDCYLKWLKNEFYVGKDEVFPNESVPTDNPNTTSVSCYVHYKKWNIVLCGDADSAYAEQSIINHHEKLFKEKDRVMLKATHHAAGSSDGYNFLEWCHPELIYISAAMVDSVCVPNAVRIGTESGAQAHPARSTLKRLLATTENVYWNAINGDITIKINGIDDVTIVGAGRNKDYYDASGNVASRDDEKNVRIKDSAFYNFFK